MELIEEEINTRGRLFYCCPRMIATCTLNQLKHKVYEKHQIEVSLGTMLNLKPIFITYATEKEKVICMFKLCLNTRLLFSPIMEHTKSSGGQEFTSITEYFMHSRNCPRALNGYYQYLCCEGKCKECKKIQLPLIPDLSGDTMRNFYQFEITKTKYISKMTGEEKTSLMTERVEYKETINCIHGRFIKMKQQYLTHMYQVRNDKFEWRNILNTINQYGCIFHIDYSENLAGTPKFESQSAHFNKRQHSLHCTVLHEVDDNDNLQYKYIYHLSDDLTHDYAFTGYVVEDILASIPALKRDKFIRFKSDNCSVQFKSKNVFNF